MEDESGLTFRGSCASMNLEMGHRFVYAHNQDAACMFRDAFILTGWSFADGAGVCGVVATK